MDTAAPTASQQRPSMDAAAPSPTNYALLARMRAVFVKPSVLTTNQGRKVGVLFHHGAARKLAARIHDAAFSNASCRLCALHASKLASVSTLEGRVFWPLGMEPRKAVHSTLIELSAAIADTPVTGLCVQSGPDVLGLPLCTTPQEGFRHYSLLVDPAVLFLLKPSADVANDRLLTRAFAHYLPALMPRLLADMLAGGGAEGALSSLTLLDDCLLVSTYGDRALPSLKWMVRMVEHVRDMGPVAYAAMTPKETWLLHAQFLLWTDVSALCGGGVVSLQFQQASKNLLSIMQTATSVEAATAMLTERFAPTVYQRAVAKPLSVAAIRQTASQLGEFHTWLMPVEELRALPACVTVARPSVYDKLLAGRQGGKRLRLYFRLQKLRVLVRLPAAVAPWRRTLRRWMTWWSCCARTPRWEWRCWAAQSPLPSWRAPTWRKSFAPCLTFGAFLAPLLCLLLPGSP